MSCLLVSALAFVTSCGQAVVSVDGAEEMGEEGESGEPGEMEESGADPLNVLPDEESPNDEEPPQNDAPPDDEPPQPLPVPEMVAPCVNGDCWDTELGGAPCSSMSHDEDFSSGNYNAHRYASMAWDETPTRVKIDASAGSWEPVLIVTSADGTTLFDGVTPLMTESLSVDVRSLTDVTITSDAPTGISVFVTSTAALDSDFVERIDTDATYTISVESDCGGERSACTANGSEIREPACGWLHYVARRVVPRLPGTREERLDAAAVVSWWSIKEGVMFLDNPIVYSNCNFPDGDARIGPTESCIDNRAWQVGLSGVQVPWHSDDEVDGAAGAAYPDLAVEDVLRLTAVEAGLAGEEIETVVGSSGTLRRSWLLRNSTVGFAVQEPVVRRECIDDTKRWCFGTGWESTRLFAADQDAAMRTIADLEALFDRVSP